MHSPISPLSPSYNTYPAEQATSAANTASAAHQTGTARRVPEPPSLPKGWTARFDEHAGKFFFTHPEKAPLSQTRIPGLHPEWGAVFNPQKAAYEYYRVANPNVRQMDPPPAPKWGVVFNPKEGTNEYYMLAKPEVRQKERPPASEIALDGIEYPSSLARSGRRIRDSLFANQGSSSAVAGPSNPKRTQSATPSAQEWLAKAQETVPELREVSGLKSWADICRHLNIDFSGDSARRKLNAHIKSEQRNEKMLNWPIVPMPE